MTYTINGKEWTEFDINLRCAELILTTPVNISHDCQQVLSAPNLEYNPCRNPWNTDRIIDKCWDELMKLTEVLDDGIADGLCTWWEYLMDYDKCTKLVAACICYIEINEAKL
jgi:hypothetical protein